MGSLHAYDRPAQAVGSNWWNEQCVFARFGDALTTRSARRRYGKARVDWDLAFFLASALGHQQSLVDDRFGAVRLGLLRGHESSSRRRHQTGSRRSNASFTVPIRRQSGFSD